MASGSLTTVLYKEQEATLRSLSGRHIIAQFDDSSVVVYQAFCPEIAEFAVQNGYFGGPLFDFNRTTWLKLSFLFTMHTSQWGSVRGRERILAIKIGRGRFLEILDSAATSGTVYQKPPGKVVSEAVILMWSPDHCPDSETLERQTLLIGLRAYMFQKFNHYFIDAIVDITDFVRGQHSVVKRKDYFNLLVPKEERFVPEKMDLCRTIMLHGFYETPTGEDLETIVEIESLRKKKWNCFAVLYFQGSFNPIHTKHVQVMLDGKKWLEKNTNYTVIAGVLGVNSAEFVIDKMKAEGGGRLLIKSYHRIRMCEISVQEYEWIHIHDRSVDTLDEYFKKNINKTKPTEQVKRFVICGADRGIMFLNSGVEIRALIIGREGVTEKLKEAYRSSTVSASASTSEIYVLPFEMENVNSTEIRKSLKRMSRVNSKARKLKNIDHLTQTGWLKKEVGDYLIEYEHDLYQGVK